MKTNHLYLGKTKNKWDKILLWITGVACVVTSIFMASFVYTTMSLNKYNVRLKEVSNEIEQIKSATDEMIEQEKQYKKQLERLEQELAQYKPIVIPDSMKE